MKEGYTPTWVLMTHRGEAIKLALGVVRGEKGGKALCAIQKYKIHKNTKYTKYTKNTKKIHKKSNYKYYMSHMDALPLCPPRPNPPYLGGRYASFLSFPSTTTKPSTEDILFIFPLPIPNRFLYNWKIFDNNAIIFATFVFGHKVFTWLYPPSIRHICFLT